MSASAYRKIAAGLDDATAWSTGNSERGRIAAGIDVKAIRSKVGLSQEDFARCLRISPKTLRDWEQRRRCPNGASRALLGIVDVDPDAALKLLAKVA